jgi:CheY-like chemotaxis protein
MALNHSKILVVEDDPDGQEVVSTILEHLRVAMDVTGSVEEAERLLFQQGQRYQAAIIDLALPGKDGWQLLDSILNTPETASMPCVAITAFHTSKLREDAIAAGFTAYFAKPIDATTFARRLEELL